MAALENAGCVIYALLIYTSTVNESITKLEQLRGEEMIHNLQNTNIVYSSKVTIPLSLRATHEMIINAIKITLNQIWYNMYDLIRELADNILRLVHANICTGLYIQHTIKYKVHTNSQ